ncbi:MAG TPA: hypothetical protein VIG97_02160 [Luteimonas sp.]
MKINIKIGAPSLTGKGANEDVATVVAGTEFPCSLQVTNHMPRAAVFPECGVELASTFADSGQSAVVEFRGVDSLKRLIRSATQIADLNGFAHALTIATVPDPSGAAAESPELADEAEAADAVTAVDTSTSEPEAAAPAAEAESNPDGSEAAAVGPNQNSDGGSATGDNGGGAGEEPAPQPVKRGRGRPPGSKSKAK